MFAAFKACGWLRRGGVGCFTFLSINSSRALVVFFWYHWKVARSLCQTRAFADVADEGFLHCCSRSPVNSTYLYTDCTCSCNSCEQNGCLFGRDGRCRSRTTPFSLFRHCRPPKAYSLHAPHSAVCNAETHRAGIATGRKHEYLFM